MRRSIPNQLRQYFNVQDMKQLNQGLDNFEPGEPFLFRNAIFTKVGQWIELWDTAGHRFGKSSEQEILCLFNEFVQETGYGPVPDLPDATETNTVDHKLR